MLFQPSNIYPSTLSGIGAGTVDVTQGLNVSWQVNGDTPMTAYQIKIYQNDTASTLKYDSGSVSVSPAFETHDRYGNPTFYTVLLSAATLSTAGIVNGYQYGYKMLITQWWGVSDYVEQTSASVFITRSLPTISIDAIPNPVTSSSLTITATYAQAQGDPISTVDWVFALAGSESNPIKNTGAVNTQVLSFDADGLINGNTYSIMCTVVTANGMEASTGFVQFTVSYSSSSLGINYQLAQLKNSSAVYLSWDDLGSNVLSYPYTDSTKTTNGITFTVNGEGDIVATGTASADAYFTIAEGTSSQLGMTAGQKFIVTSGYSGAKIVVTETNSSNVVVSTITGNDPLQYIATSTTNTLKFSIVIMSGTALGAGQQLQPMIAIENKIVALNDVSVTMQPIQSGSGTPSPDNVRPITGRTGVNVYRTGKNVAKLGSTVTTSALIKDLADNSVTVYNTSTGAEYKYARLSVLSAQQYAGQTLTFTAKATVVTGTSNPRIICRLYESDYNTAIGSNIFELSGTTFSRSITLPATIPEGAVLCLNLYSDSGAGGAHEVNYYDIQLELGSTATTYEPYQGTTYSVDWSTQAGTVYGGTLDVVTGVLTVTHAISTITETVNASTSYSRFILGALDILDVEKPSYCNILTPHSGTSSTIGINKYLLLNSSAYNSSQVNIKLVENQSSQTAMRDANNAILAEWAADGHPLQIVWGLSTPLTYQLTPQEVAALVTNNVWTNAGDVTVSYTTDTGSQATISGPIVSFSNTNAQNIPTPQYIPGITGLSIYRYLQGELALQHVYDLATGATSILDYFAPSQTRVSYLLVAHSNVGDLFLQTNDFVPTFWFYSVLLCDTDSNGNYHVSREYIFKYGVETGAISNNNGPTIQKNFTPYPNRQPISSLYKTGKLSGYIGKTNNLNQYSDTISLQNAIFEISTSSLTKFIKSRKGDILMADTAAPIQMQTEDNTTEQALKATIDWVEVGDADQVSIVSISTDPFWPLP